MTIERLTIDTPAATNTVAQTNAIYHDTLGTCSMPVTDITVRDITVRDCIRLLGNTPDPAVGRVSIMGSLFPNCPGPGSACSATCSPSCLATTSVATGVGRDGDPSRLHGQETPRLNVWFDD
jgi:hypothetical protein